MAKIDNNAFINRAEAGLSKGKAITQMGLFTDDLKAASQFLDRVKTFNLRNLDRPVRVNALNVDNEKGDEDCPRPHVKFTLMFKNREAQRDFWTT